MVDARLTGRAEPFGGEGRRGRAGGRQAVFGGGFGFIWLGSNHHHL